MEPQQSTATNDYKTLPTEWPGAKGLYKYARSATLTNWRLYLCFTIISFIVIPIIKNAISPKNSPNTIVILFQLITILMSIFFSAACIVISLHSAKHEKTDLSQTITEAMNFFFSYLLLTIITYAIIIVSAVLLFLPLLYIGPKLSLAPYYLIDQHMNPFDAIQASWEATTGNLRKVWGIVVMNILFLLIFITIIGIPLAFYFIFMYNTAAVLLYTWVKGKIDTSQVS